MHTYRNPYACLHAERKRHEEEKEEAATTRVYYVSILCTEAGMHLMYLSYDLQQTEGPIPTDPPTYLPTYLPTTY